jgi:predicted ABC-type transport system involved in lysophospholipase L1 biosynthesis ATPase subunit
MSYLELRQVSKSFGVGATEVHALSDVDLAVERGSLVAVMGPSGSGKSTLLTIAGSLEEPTTGEVVIDGAALSAMSRNDKARLRRRTVGYVFQDFNLLAGLTAAENVSLPLELDGVSAKKAHLAGIAVLEELDEQRGRDADDPRGLSPRRGGDGRHPRRAAGFVGGSGRLHPGRTDRGPNGPATHPRIPRRRPPRARPPPLARRSSTGTRGAGS